MSASNYDVVVVGAGPAGLSAAIGLARADFAVLVLEAAPFPGAENWSGCVFFAENLAHPDLLGPAATDGLAWERRLVERGIFSTDGQGLAGLTYRDPAAFHHCYTVLRPIYDHHLAEVAKTLGVTILASTTAEGLIRERGRVIGVSTNRGAVYADLVFLAEGDAAHLVTKEGYERHGSGRQGIHFLHGVKQVIHMPPGAIEDIFGLGAEEGAAYEIVLRNGTVGGRAVALNMGGFLYTNRASISLGLVLPLERLRDGFGGDPHRLLEWFKSLPEIRRWTEGGTPGAFGAKLIRAGGAREIPHLVDHGLAIGGAASGVGIDFPYPNFTGPATMMGLVLARAAIAIRRGGGGFSLTELRDAYLTPLQDTHYWDDVQYLRRWPSYLAQTRSFFDRDVDLVQGTLRVWSRPGQGVVGKWWHWVKLLRAVAPPARWAEVRDDLRHLGRAIRLPALLKGRAPLRVLLDGSLNALRDLCHKPRAALQPSGTLRLIYRVRAGQEPAGPLPRPVVGWGTRMLPVLACAARELYRNDPVALRRKLSAALKVVIEQINLLDVAAVAVVGVLAALSMLVQAAIEWCRRAAGVEAGAPACGDRGIEGPGPAAPSLVAAHASPDGDGWMDQLGRLSYFSTKQSHIKVLWPTNLAEEGAIAGSGLWNLCPAKVYECRTDSMGQVQVVVNFENCIKCETCWRGTDLVDWGRTGSQRLIYHVPSPAVDRLLATQRAAARCAPRRPRALDWWQPRMELLAQWMIEADRHGADGRFAGELAQLDRLTQQLAAKLAEFDAAVADEPRTIGISRSRFLESIVLYERQIVEEITEVLRTGPLSRAQVPGLDRVRAFLLEQAEALAAKVDEQARRAWDRQFFWAVNDSHQIQAHHLHGLSRTLRILRGQVAPGPGGARLVRRGTGVDSAAQPDRGGAESAASLAAQLDPQLGPNAWRRIDTHGGLTAAQLAALRGVIAGVPPLGDGAGLYPRARKVVLAELARRDPSLGFLAASHLWARDLIGLRRPGGAPEALAAQIAACTQTAALALDGPVEIVRGDEGDRVRGEKHFVPLALGSDRDPSAVDWFVVPAEGRLLLVPRTAAGVRIDRSPLDGPRQTLGLRGARPSRLVLEDVPLAAARVLELDDDQARRAVAVLSSADLAALALGLAGRLCERAIEQATSRVQFPGMFHDEDFREAIGKFGAVKKMVAQMVARRDLIEALVADLTPTDLSAATADRAVRIKAVVAEALASAPGSLAYNAVQVFGGTGYSEEEIVAKLCRDAAAWRFLGQSDPVAMADLGGRMLDAWTDDGASLSHLADEAGRFERVAQRKVLQAELDSLHRAQGQLRLAVNRWLHGAGRDAQDPAVMGAVAEDLARCDAAVLAGKVLLLRTHARLEAGGPSEAAIESLRVWVGEVSERVARFVLGLRDVPATAQWAGEPGGAWPAPSTPAGPPAPYHSGDFLIQPIDLAGPRFVPEMVQCIEGLREFDARLDDLFRRRYRDQLYDGLPYDRWLENQHGMPPEELRFCTEQGFFRMLIPRDLGGEGRTKAEYYQMILHSIREADIGQALTLQVNGSIGTTPILLALGHDLPEAVRDLETFRDDAALHDRLTRGFDEVLGLMAAGTVEPRRIEKVFHKAGEPIRAAMASRPVLRELCGPMLDAWAAAEAAARRLDQAAVRRQVERARDAWRQAQESIAELLVELDRRRRANELFLRWIAGGRIAAFALTEPSAGSDTARLASRARLRSVEVSREPDGVLSFLPAAPGPSRGAAGRRYLIDADRLELRLDGVFYRWSDSAEPSPIRFDAPDPQTGVVSQPPSYDHGGRLVHFTDVAQLRRRDGRLVYDYWELTGSKMWITNGRICGVMALYAKTERGVTGFLVDRHAEGLVVGTDEAKMGQLGSVTNELSLQAVRVPRENILGLEGRGQVNALETLERGRAGMAISCVGLLHDLLARTESYARARYGELPGWVAARLARMAESRYACAALAYELIGRGDQPGVESIQMEAAIGKMFTSEALHHAIEMAEDVYGLDGQTAAHNVEKHKRDARVIPIYEGTNEIQRFAVLRGLVKDVWPRWRRADEPAAHLAEEFRLLAQSKRELGDRLGRAVEAFGQTLWRNPNFQGPCFPLAEVAAAIKVMDSVLARTSWLIAHRGPEADPAELGAARRISRRVVVRLRHEVQLRLARFDDDLAALRQACYPPEVQVAELVFRAAERAGGPTRRTDSTPAAPASAITRPLQVLVVVEPEPVLAPTPQVAGGRLREPSWTLPAADAAALAQAVALAAGAEAPVRVLVAAAGPEPAIEVIREALARGADEAVLVDTGDGPVAAESAAQALAAVLHQGRPFDLILSRAVEPGSDDGLIGMLLARTLGLPYLAATAMALQVTDERATVDLWTPGAGVRSRGLPLAIAWSGASGLADFHIDGFLRSPARKVRLVAWPGAVPRQAVEIRPGLADWAASRPAVIPHPLDAPQAARLILAEAGLDLGPAGPAVEVYPDPIEAVDEPRFAEDGVVFVAVADAAGKLAMPSRRALDLARSLARHWGRPLDVLVLCPDDDLAQRRLAAGLVGLGVDSVCLAPSAHLQRGGVELWGRIVNDLWPRAQGRPAAVLAETWADPVLAGLARQSGTGSTLVLRAARIEPHGAGLTIEVPHCRNRLRSVRTLGDWTKPATGRPEPEACGAGRTLWLTVVPDAQVDLPAAGDSAAAPARVVRCRPSREPAPDRAELGRVLDAVQETLGVERLADADFIIDMGAGVADRDGFEQVIVPLRQALEELGVRRLMVAGTRKAVEELKLLPLDRQIGQTGESVNPAVVLAIGVSGAPQHLNSIGPRATILAFNRDPEAPIMTLNQRQPRPRVFPVAGDLFQTVPALVAALKDQGPKSSAMGQEASMGSR